MTINFYLKDNKAENTSIIIHLWSKIRVRWSVGETISPALWDQDKQYPKRSEPNYLFICGYLDKCRKTAQDYYKSARLDGKRISQISFREYMNDHLHQQDQEMDLLKYISHYVDKRSNSGLYAHQSIKKYNVIKNRLEDFAKAWHRPMTFNNIDYDFFYDFSNWMFETKEYGSNTAAKYLSYLKSILNEATEQGINTNLTFRSKRFQIKGSPADKIYLTEEELIKAYHFKFDDEHKHLSNVRDAYLIASFTGLRFSDFSILSSDHITTIKGSDFIQKFNKKTKRTVYIPVHPVVRALLKTETYKDIPVNQVFNRQIKAAFRKMKILEFVFVKESKNGLVVEKKISKAELITAHTARSNFITNALIAGIPEKAIMDMTGISNINTIKTYQRLKPKDSAVIAMNSDFFKSDRWVMKA